MSNLNPIDESPIAQLQSQLEYILEQLEVEDCLSADEFEMLTETKAEIEAEIQAEINWG